LYRDKVIYLNAEIAKLKAGMSPEGSSTALTATGDERLSSESDTLSPLIAELYTGEDVVVDPAAMQDKIRQLSSRISEVCLYLKSLSGSVYYSINVSTLYL